jgi:hypothetical protein
MDKAICEMTYEEASAEYSACMKEAFDLTHSFKELAFYRDRAESIRLYIVEKFFSSNSAKSENDVYEKISDLNSNQDLYKGKMVADVVEMLHSPVSDGNKPLNGHVPVFRYMHGNEFIAPHLVNAGAVVKRVNFYKGYGYKQINVTIYV